MSELRILLVEDSEFDAELLRRALAKEDMDFSLERVDREEDFLRALSASQIDLILSDYQLPSFSGMAALALRQAHAPLIPFIVVTGTLSEETAVSCIKAGADDYLLKEHLVRLGPAVRSALERKRTLSEKNHAEERLRQSEEQLRLILENAVDLIALVDLSGRLLFMSPSCKRAFGASALDGGWLDNVHPEDRAQALHAFEEAVQLGVGRRMEYRVIVDENRLRFIESHLSVILGEDGSPQKAVVVSRDITERKQAEESLIQKTKQLELLNEELKQFAFVASHHLQEPLRKVLLFTDRLETCGTSSSDVENDCLGRIRKAALHMRALIQDVVQYSWITQRENTLERVDLGVVVGEVLMDLEGSIAESGGEVKVGKLDTLQANSFQMKHLFSSLLSNSLKFARKGVPPRISIGSSLLAGGDKVEIVVEDNGIGFDEKYLDRIFRAFQQLHAPHEYQGTGIGLSICQKIVQSHGGTLRARSRLGEGATFLITLPVNRESPHPGG